MVYDMPNGQLAAFPYVLKVSWPELHTFPCHFQLVNITVVENFLHSL